MLLKANFYHTIVNQEGAEVYGRWGDTPTSLFSSAFIITGENTMDKDGYPTKKELTFIRRFNCLIRPASELIEFIEARWWAKDWGFKLAKVRDEYASVVSPDDNHPRRRYHYRLELHTGGWSGNEDIIRALEQNRWFHVFFWYSSRTGGHYEFRINEKDYEKKGKGK